MRPRFKHFVSLLLLSIACLLGGRLAIASDTHRVGSVFRDCTGGCPEIVVLGPGSYLMRSSPEDAHQGKDGEERPQHRVNIAYAFAVGRYEVTREEYAAFVHDT